MVVFSEAVSCKPLHAYTDAAWIIVPLLNARTQFYCKVGVPLLIAHIQFYNRLTVPLLTIYIQCGYTGDSATVYCTHTEQLHCRKAIRD